MSDPAGVGATSSDLGPLVERARADLDAAHAAREACLPACRQVVRAAASSIRAVHRREFDRAAGLADESEAALRVAQAAVAEHPQVAFAGFVHDAAKEYAEARITAALVRGAPVPSHDELGIEPPAWLNGLAEAASELRRHLLDRLRVGELDVAESLLASMEDVYSVLVTIDHPDAITGGLRRTTDALRAVLERTRGDLTVTVLQTRLQAAIESRLPES